MQGMFTINVLSPSPSRRELLRHSHRRLTRKQRQAFLRDPNKYRRWIPESIRAEYFMKLGNALDYVRSPHGFEISLERTATTLL